MRKLVLLLMVAACGDDGVRHTPDAAPHGDGPVTPDGPVDAAGTPVTITTVRTGGVPVMGVHVYFQNADGTVVLATTTDATGTASAVMAAGGSVTAIDPYTPPPFGGTFDSLFTFVGVKPGDHLQLTQPPVQTAIQVTVGAPDVTGGVSYTAYSTCNKDGQQLTAPPPPPTRHPAVVAAPESATMSLFSCGATADFLIVAYDDAGQASNMIYAPNIAVSDGGTVDLTASTYTAGMTRDYTFNNVPALRSLSVEDDLVSPMGRIYPALNETPSDTINPTMTMTEPVFTGAGSLIQTSYSGAGGLDQQMLVDWGPWASTFTTDVGARALYDFNAPATFDPATHTASIGEDTTAGNAPDFTAVFLSAFRGSRSWAWNVIAPHAASVTLPALPTDVFDFNIVAGDSPSVNGWATGKVPGGYDAVRGILFSTTGPQDLALGSTTGSATLVSTTQGPTTRTAGHSRRWAWSLAGHRSDLR